MQYLRICICNTASLIEIYYNSLGPAYKVCKETGEWWAYPNSTQSWSNYTLCSAVNIEVNTSSNSNISNRWNQICILICIHIYSFIDIISVCKHDKHHITKWVLSLDMRSFIVAIYILLFQVKYQNMNVVWVLH